MGPMRPQGTTPATPASYTVHITGEALSSPRLIPPKHSQPMTTTTLRAAAAHVRTALAAIDWQEAMDITADGLRILWGALELLAALLVMAAEITYEHRAQIRAALIRAAAATYLAGTWTRRQAVRTYEAGQWARLQLEAISGRSTALLPAQPVPALAPITATITAAREALERLVSRLYPVAA